MKMKLEGAGDPPAPSQQNAVASSPRPQSLSPSSPKMPRAWLDDLEKGAATGKQAQASDAATLAPVPPAPKQGPLARLPLELGEKIFAFLGEESVSAQLRLRTVSRGFARASRNAQPALDDQIASGYLRKMLPQGLSVGGGLNLNGTGITQLPQGLSVGGGLNLNGTGITLLPQGLSVGGYLNLSETDITQLPQGLSVDGDLDLYRTRITQLPQGLSVRRNLNLSGSRITQLPDDLKVSGEIFH